MSAAKELAWWAAALALMGAAGVVYLLRLSLQRERTPDDAVADPDSAHGEFTPGQLEPSTAAAVAELALTPKASPLAAAGDGQASCCAADLARRSASLLCGEGAYFADDGGWADAAAADASRRVAAVQQELARMGAQLADKPDPLTGLATRLQLEDRLDAASRRVQGQQHRLALLYIDLDDFGALNDRIGDAQGDRLLQEIGRRLQSLGRSSDTVARMGADEFVILMDGDPDQGSASAYAHRIREHLAQPHALAEGQSLSLSCSVGIVLYPEHGPRARLIAHAEVAAAAAKRAGGGLQCFYDQDLEHDLQEALDIHRDLRLALAQSQGLSLCYQPKIDARTGAVLGVEALLRWQHASRGLVSPHVMVAVAERFGLIGALGEWILERTCMQLRAWSQAGLRMPISVNLSAHQLRQPDLHKRVLDIVERQDVDASLLSFEVGESSTMGDAQASMRVFERLVNVGARVSIDNVGTGFSSLSHLRRLPATHLKIDRCFVQEVDRQEDAQAIVRAVIKLAHALELVVTACGVETLAQERELKRMGCDELQGHWYAKPMTAEQLEQWLHSEAVPARRASFHRLHDLEDEAPGAAVPMG